MKSKLLGLVGVALGLILCGWLYSRQGVLRLASVDIENVDNMDLEVAVKRKIAPYLGANLLTLSLADLQRNLQEDPRIKKVFVSRKLPSTLTLRIVERLPVATVLQRDSARIIGDEGQEITGVKQSEKLPIWVRYQSVPYDRKKVVAEWLSELRAQDHDYFLRLSELEWVVNRGLVLSVQSKPATETEAATWVQVDMGTLNFGERWRRLKLVLDWMLDEQIQGERLIALGDGQVVISGVKNLHNLKNELNLKEIVRRATPQGVTRVQAR